MGLDRTIDITADQHKIILSLLQKFLPNTTVWVYGSRVKWTSHPQSDLDMVVFSTPEQTLQTSSLREAFDESNLPFPIDLFVWNDVPETFRAEIEAEHVVLQKEEKRNAHSNWRRVKVEDIAEKVAMGPFGSSIKVDTFVPEGVPIISGQHLHGFRVDDSPGFNFISLEHAQRLSNANVQRGDVIFTHAGNIGQVAYIPEQSKFDRYIISQRQFYMRCDRSKVIPEFVALYFKSPEGQHQLLANAAQVGVPSIAQPVTYLRTIEIPLPPLPEQRAIAHILGTLDDKIELNKHMNETLEEMARALFKSWFIDFDPIRAKIEGRDTGLPKRITDLFPDRVVESELGEIPEGWDVGALDDVVELFSGGTPRTSVSEYWDGIIPWYTAKDSPSLSDVFVLETERNITQAGVENSATKILPAQTTIISARGTVGRLACLGIPMAMNQTCYGIRGAGGYTDFFTYWSVRAAVDELQRRTHGTIFDTITRQTFKLIETTLVPVDLVDEFESVVTPIMAYIHKNLIESRILSNLRDMLLQKLLSGEQCLPILK